ncbi:NAD(P)-dependent oxidoreductase [Streptomyces sp. NPDC053367]|uniref:NAD(P)-dependent oxidoreductase n=1 Tax=Streptomyces sp. NPDC053367 TaxID=3365700 RepID=UPI0037D853A9
MKLTVFGATGGIGGQIVRQALDAGHEVTAVVRDPARLGVEAGGRLEVVRAELTDARSLRPALAGRDAVLSGLGARSRKDAGVAARLTRTVLDAMEAAEVRRLVVVSAGPVGPEPDDGFLDRGMRAIVSAVLKEVYDDLRAMEAALAGSATDWTVVRPPRLQDKPLTGSYRTVVGGFPPRGRFIGRADVAHAMLALTDDPGAVRQGVGVAY